MARRAKKKEANGETNVTPIRSNGLDTKLTTGFLDRILNLYVALDGERSDYMLECKSIRKDMSVIYDEAKDKGVPMRGLKCAVKKRLLELKIDRIRDDLDGEDLDDYDMVLQALGDLGDTPLGKAALTHTANQPAPPPAAASPEQLNASF
jgi:hypothetical protein